MLPRLALLSTMSVALLAGCAGSGTRSAAQTTTDAQRAAAVNLELGQGYM